MYILSRFIVQVVERVAGLILMKLDGQGVFGLTREATGIMKNKASKMYSQRCRGSRVKGSFAGGAGGWLLSRAGRALECYPHELKPGSI
jgi:hypothetical protein